MQTTAASCAASRRDFVKGSAAAVSGLLLGFVVPESRGLNLVAEAANTVFAPNAFLRIAPDNSVTVISKHLEHGMGIHTGLATILAEELDADWSQIRVEPASANVELYKNLTSGTQNTFGSRFDP
jgi:isoquinoline 1-oxidoreductase subunit beta